VSSYLNEMMRKGERCDAVCLMAMQFLRDPSATPEQCQCSYIWRREGSKEAKIALCGRLLKGHGRRWANIFSGIWGCVGCSWVGWRMRAFAGCTSF